MTAVDRVRRTQRGLALLGAVRAAGWAGAALFGVLAAGAALAALVPVPPAVLAGVPWLAGLAALVTLAVLGWRGRFVTSLPRVALWIEERAPELEYALVTAVDPRYATALGPSLEPALQRVDQGAFVRRVAWRSVLPALLALAVTGFAFNAVPSEWSQRLGVGSPFGRPAGPTELPSRLEPLRVTVTPPAYAAAVGVRTQKLKDPTTVAGLAGSKVEITGPHGSEGIEARLGDTPLKITAANDGWSASFTLPDSATGLRLADRQYSRLLVLAPQRDEPPVVQLVLPARDTTVREPTGSVTLDARLTDDFGLAKGHFEYIISSGESEGNYEFRHGTLAARALGNAKEGQLRITVPLGSLKLKAGDQLQLRAVAIDNNTYSGPDTGYSDPRMLRVARPNEYDSLAVEGAPPPDEKALMTLRYLIQLTERLHQVKPKLERKVFVDSSRGLGARAERLRAQVEQLQADQTMGGMFPPNPLLNTAYLAMIDGETSLKIAEPGEAIPRLWEALRALQKYAFAKRHYLRGQMREELVNLERVRLTGSDTGHARARTPRAAADTGRVRQRRLYAEAVGHLRAAPDSAVERLLLLQVEALRAEPGLAAALGDAIAAVRAGRDAADPLRRTRRFLDGPAVVLDTLPRWSGAW